jgi:hypothetical protein
MITLTRTYTRPSIDVLWHPAALRSEWVSDYIKTTYKDTGKMLSETFNWNDPIDLSINYVSVWLDMAAFEEYNNDERLLPYWTERNTYNEYVGIIVSPQVITES